MIEPPSPDDFLSGHVRTGRPVLIRGLAAGWPAVERWTASYLAETAKGLGDILVPYRSTPADLERMDLSRINRGRASLTGILRDCARSPREGEELYVPGLDLPLAGPLGQDVGRPSVLEPLELFAATVFLGRNTKCIGHFHAKAQAMLCQVQGTKRVWMFPPSQIRRLYPFAPWAPNFFQSQVNFYGDLRQFEKLSRAEGLVFELEPGDALFIPLHWLHVPEGDGWSVSVTHWWRPGLAEWARSVGTARALTGVGSELVRRALEPLTARA